MGLFPDNDVFRVPLWLSEHIGYHRLCFVNHFGLLHRYVLDQFPLDIAVAAARLGNHEIQENDIRQHQDEEELHPEQVIVWFFKIQRRGYHAEVPHWGPENHQKVSGEQIEMLEFFVRLSEDEVGILVV